MVKRPEEISDLLRKHLKWGQRVLSSKRGVKLFYIERVIAMTSSSSAKSSS